VAFCFGSDLSPHKRVKTEVRFMGLQRFAAWCLRYLCLQLHTYTEDQPHLSPVYLYSWHWLGWSWMNATTASARFICQLCQCYQSSCAKLSVVGVPCTTSTCLFIYFGSVHYMS
jgi:hypothetical protein